MLDINNFSVGNMFGSEESEEKIITTSEENIPSKEEKIEIMSTHGSSSGGLEFETAIDCMICGNPFMQDWQHKEYNMCPSCRKAIKSMIGR